MNTLKRVLLTIGIILFRIAKVVVLGIVLGIVIVIAIILIVWFFGWLTTPFIPSMNIMDRGLAVLLGSVIGFGSIGAAFMILRDLGEWIYDVWFEAKYWMK